MNKFIVNLSGKAWLTGLCLLTVLLQGCMDVATTGASALYQRHSIQKNLKDQYITMQAYHAMSKNARVFRGTNIAIATYNREVLLAGQVPVLSQKNKLEDIAKSIDDVDKIYNFVEVKSPSSVLTHVSDVWITAKIKTKLMASNDVDGSQVKVVTENGTVYLMGLLLPEQADAAVSLASNTDGVLKVVKIFSYLKIMKHPNA